MDRGDWRATIHQVTKSQIQLKLLSMQTQKAKLIYVLEVRMWLLMHKRGFSFVQNQKKKKTKTMHIAAYLLLLA